MIQPESETNYSGTDVTFSVVAIGSSPLYYQWSRQGVGEIPGATNAIYTFVSQYPGDNGAIYSVTISNSLGNAVSEFATNTVETDILVEGPPFSITRNVGSHAAFRVAAVGALPIGYQWSVSTNGGATFQPDRPDRRHALADQRANDGQRKRICGCGDQSLHQLQQCGDS